ncbi:probable glutamate carboxypeptidase LAMP1 isoform X1 [Capsicum annuum]|uniref:probable glutamate carboxypeptidase LAMP1 isoform X1 n=1 Tax=Capsicum annuum TaxID=4072 RepID=UPI001FB1A0E9|nr:probable glutamate carboxypeptidase LAMP1 isoform X1 [Capsicum annuum]
MTEKSARKCLCHSREDVSRFVILGNHRDAWTFGAVDPNSGTATLLVIAQRLEKLQKIGWKPRRTIVLCNWDAEEYGLIGSAEWVEENREMLAARVVAYLNVDCPVQGGPFRASATPQLDDIIIEAARQVQDPDNSSQTIYQSWLASDNDTIVKLGRLGGAGSDYAAFVQHLAPKKHVEFIFRACYPVYHSMYDDFVWMKKFGDPMFHRDTAVASIWGLVALRLVDDEVFPFNYLSYAIEL